ncbi:beta-lactamase family protein [Actinospica durhamensis]|uniref:Beta-lactamase family protein n=1 Tax=Actinospica durhamensis TaxID=1508375 RepID=A0A941IUQ3_9ACTN|nr:serine hydrolase domain-containing protein [Actinospica durhamensis]MBR7839457.1 beta-lactamase family protein [Actinospica durhamensis]
MNPSDLIAAVSPHIPAPDAALAAATISTDSSKVDITPSTADSAARFEIGSVTKTMTATLLALLVGEGALGLDDEIGRWLDAGDNARITVVQLATHTSGLPGMSPQMRERASSNPKDPWSGYGFAHAEHDLRQLTPNSAPDASPWAYSNLGYQLLALILERASTLPYPRLLQEHLLEPLGMADSRVGHAESDADDGLLLEGHGSTGPVGPRAHPLGAGGVEATIEDFARYARACLFPPATPLGDAIKLAQEPRVRVNPDTEQALGWLARGGTLREHSGATAGFTACVHLNRAPGHEGAVAMLAAYGGSIALASHFKAAAQRALTGQDPGDAEPARPFEDWRRKAVETVELLLAGKFQRVHEGLVPARREKTSPDMIAAAWHRALASAGDPDPSTVTIRHEQTAAGGALIADVAITCSRRPLGIRLAILPNGALGGLTPLPG